MSDGGGMSLIVKNVACVLLVPVMVFGLYVILHGHLTPGGGFPGGAVMATLVALLLVAFGSRTLKLALKKSFFSAVEALGLVFFLLLAFFGLGRSFFNNFLANSGGLFGLPVAFGSNSGFLMTAGVIPLMNIAVGIEVFAALSLIMIMVFGGGSE